MDQISESRFPSDAQVWDWISRSLQGEESAFKKLVEVYASSLQVVIYRILGDWEETRDVSQEVFIRAHRSLHQYKPIGRFHSWLFQIGAHMAIDAVRKRERRPVSTEWVEEVHSDAREDLSLQQKEISQAIERAVQSLPIDLRTAFVLSEYENLSYKELSGVLDCSTKAVEMKIYRARQMLREKLKSFLTDLI